MNTKHAKVGLSNEAEFLASLPTTDDLSVLYEAAYKDFALKKTKSEGIVQMWTDIPIEQAIAMDLCCWSDVVEGYFQHTFGGMISDATITHLKRDIVDRHIENQRWKQYGDAAFESFARLHYENLFVAAGPFWGEKLLDDAISDGDCTWSDVVSCILTGLHNGNLDMVGADTIKRRIIDRYEGAVILIEDAETEFQHGMETGAMIMRQLAREDANDHGAPYAGRREGTLFSMLALSISEIGFDEVKQRWSQPKAAA